MIAGHYAAALYPRARLGSRAPFWLLLVCANVPEFLWLALASIGAEAPTDNRIDSVAMRTIDVQMTYSHNLFPAIVQGNVVLAVVHAWRRDWTVSLWCGALTLFHVLSDFVVGFEHQWLDPNGPTLSLDTYGRAPRIAITIELLFSLTMIAHFAWERSRRGQRMPRKHFVYLVLAFVFPIVSEYTIAERSLRDRLGERNSACGAPVRQS